MVFAVWTHQSAERYKITGVSASSSAGAPTKASACSGRLVTS